MGSFEYKYICEYNINVMSNEILIQNEVEIAKLK